jgi:hypothetical protein
MALTPDDKRVDEFITGVVVVEFAVAVTTIDDVRMLLMVVVVVVLLLLLLPVRYEDRQ